LTLSLVVVFLFSASSSSTFLRSPFYLHTSSPPFTAFHPSEHPSSSEFIMFATKFGLQSDDYKICVVMVGLPARGKSLIAGKGKLTWPSTAFTA
jgi:hypothetical protein